MLSPVPVTSGDPRSLSRTEDRAHFKPYELSRTSDHNDNNHPKYWTLDPLTTSTVCTPLLHHERPTALRSYVINILKIDMESGKFDTLTTFLTANAVRDVLPIGQPSSRFTHVTSVRTSSAGTGHWRRRGRRGMGYTVRAGSGVYQLGAARDRNWRRRVILVQSPRLFIN
jgi:hypothetical protein